MTANEIMKSIKDNLDSVEHNLEQIQCDDCISRQAVETLVDELARAISDERCYVSRGRSTATIMRDILHLPPVTPQPKTGHWIGDAKTYYEELNKRGLGVDEYTPYFTDDIACSECLAKYSMLDNETQFFKHCLNCGCRMIEEQERSDKE